MQPTLYLYNRGDDEILIEESENGRTYFVNHEKRSHLQLSPNFWGGTTPIYNHKALAESKNELILIFPTEAEVDHAADFFRENRKEFVAISFLDVPHGMPDLSLFRDRSIIFWPGENKTWLRKYLNFLAICAEDIRCTKVSENFIQYCETNNPHAAMLDLEYVKIEEPIVELEDGFSDLEGIIPERFIARVKSELGDPKTGLIDNEYNVLLRLTELDPAFRNLLKYDLAQGQILHSKKYTGLDDVENALLNRFSKYGIKRMSKEVRWDVIKTLSRKPENQFNSILTLFETLEKRFPEPKEALIHKLFSYIKVSSYSKTQDGVQPDVMMYARLLEHWMLRSCLKIRQAYTAPIANDLVPILIGKQGLGKSRFWQYLALEDRYFVDVGDKTDSKVGSADFIRFCAGKLIANFGEMQVYHKNEIEAVKTNVSQRIDSFRQLYERSITHVPRLYNYCADSNESAPLKDKTANRRFFLFYIDSIDEELFAQKELAAELWAYYWKKSGEMLAKGQTFNKLEDDLKTYFDGVAEAAVDTGFLGESVKNVVRDLEKERYQECKARGKPVLIGIYEIGQKVLDGNFSHQREFGSTLTFILTMWGYKKQTVRIDGKIVPGYKIESDDPKLMARVIDEDEIPF